MAFQINSASMTVFKYSSFPEDYQDRNGILFGKFE